MEGCVDDASRGGEAFSLYTNRQPCLRARRSIPATRISRTQAALERVLLHRRSSRSQSASRVVSSRWSVWRLAVFSSRRARPDRSRVARIPVASPRVGVAPRFRGGAPLDARRRDDGRGGGGARVARGGGGVLRRGRRRRARLHRRRGFAGLRQVHARVRRSRPHQRRRGCGRRRGVPHGRLPRPARGPRHLPGPGRGARAREARRSPSTPPPSSTASAPPSATATPSPSFPSSTTRCTTPRRTPSPSSPRTR